MGELLRNTQDLVERKIDATRAIGRWIIEHSPIGSAPRMNIVDVHERVEDLIQGKYPFEDETVEQPEFWDEHGYPHYLPKEHPVSNRSDAELGWDDMGTYYIGESGKSHPKCDEE